MHSQNIEIQSQINPTIPKEQRHWTMEGLVTPFKSKGRESDDRETQEVLQQ